MKKFVQKLSARLPVRAKPKPAPKKARLKLSGQRCQNCQAPLYGRYCAVCGQRHYTGKNPYWEFIEDVTDQMISPESKLWRTFSHLLVLPGLMTRNYFRGMRASYAPPVRLYLIGLVAFFAAIELLNVAVFKLSMVANESVFTEQQREDALTDIDQRINEAREAGRDEKFIQVLERVRGEIQNRKVTEQDSLLSVVGANFQFVPVLKMFAPLGQETADEEEAEVTPEMVDSFFEIAQPVEDAGPISDFLRRVQNGFVRAAEDPTRLNHSINIWLPRVMVIFVPMFGIFLRVFYWRKEYFILNQMVFSLHFHTALFFFLTFFLLAQATFGGIADTIGTILFTYGFPVFMYLSLKNAYGDGWIKTFGKFLVIGAFYAFGVSAMLAAVFLLGLAQV